MLEDSTSHRGIHYPLTGPQDSFGCAGRQDQTFYDNTEALAFFFSVLVQGQQWVRVPTVLALIKVVAAKKAK